MDNSKAILLLAYGTPENLDDMKPYLLDIRGGRPTPNELVEEMTDRYRQIGGSPLNRHTFTQAGALSAELAQRGHACPVYVGMRHWQPRIKEAVQKMHQDGVKEATAIVMAPHYSSLSVGRYEEAIRDAQQELGSDIEVTLVRSWWRQPKLLAAFEERVRTALARFGPEECGALKVIFSAHSLPQRVLDMGDPYDDELKAHARTLAKQLGDVDWTFAYQSAGASNEPWLGPALEEEVPRLAGEGYKQMLVAPLGFVCDHVEILYDIDIEAKALADDLGIRLERIESMNQDSLFIQAVADAVEHTGEEA